MWTNKSMINAAIKRGFCSKAPQRNKSNSLTKHLKLSYYSITPLIAYSGDRILNPIVMYHGLMATKDIWQPIIDPLLRHTNRAVFVVDARNHGESPFHKYHSLNALTTDLNYFLEEMKIDKAVLIGQGCGAKSVLQLATRRPDKVEKLIALDLNSTSIPGIHTSVMKKVNDALIQATLKVEEDESLQAARARLFLKLAHILDVCFVIAAIIVNDIHVSFKG
ncbi:uncharacterized protein B4U80_12987 [Leptotrombidium deliense]|uniref:sn-1-specific diacylglycerol lipase ABHD11 n=1 Tax=Leptotrombidium deliense TaxID=299467 RepID=A0A443SFP9_9ACAR|nr:uncharacterized protein B4U80_12987 [Leptotrombidium deliense]